MKFLSSTQQKTLFALAFIFVLMLLVTACTPENPAIDSTINETPDYAGKKILWVNSYHEGYPWSDGIQTGLHSVLDETGIELKELQMDTKQNPDEAFGQAAGIRINEEIEKFQPDIVIASDDNAQKYLVVPFLKDTELPVIFNGVNWDASDYGYPTSNITGMVEVELADQVVELLGAHSQGKELGYITIDTETERKIVETYNQLFFDGKMKPYWAKTQEEFKALFITAQQEVDILFMGNNAGSDQWNEEEMAQFVIEYATVPVGAINDWMAPYSLLTLAKSAQEQGEWSAQTALSILSGTPVSEIPITENKIGEMILNLELADKLDIVFAPSLLKNASILGQ